MAVIGGHATTASYAHVGDVHLVEAATMVGSIITRAMEDIGHT